MSIICGGRQQVTEFAGYKISSLNEVLLTEEYQSICNIITDTSSVFYELIFQVNSSDIMIKMDTNENQVFEVSLDDLESNWNLKGDNSNQAINELLGLSQFAVNRWRFKPPIPIEFISLTIQMKKISGNNRKVLRGKVGWGER